MKKYKTTRGFDAEIVNKIVGSDTNLLTILTDDPCVKECYPTQSELLRRYGLHFEGVTLFNSERDVVIYYGLTTIEDDFKEGELIAVSNNQQDWYKRKYLYTNKYGKYVCVEELYDGRKDGYEYGGSFTACTWDYAKRYIVYMANAIDTYMILARYFYPQILTKRSIQDLADEIKKVMNPDFIENAPTP